MAGEVKAILRKQKESSQEVLLQFVGMYFGVSQIKGGMKKGGQGGSKIKIRKTLVAFLAKKSEKNEGKTGDS